MQYLRARYYDQNNGRFNRVDPFNGHMGDPQSLHKYAYCHSDPVGGVDPSGEMALVTLLFFSVVFLSLTTTFKPLSPYHGIGKKPLVVILPFGKLDSIETKFVAYWEQTKREESHNLNISLIYATDLNNAKNQLENFSQKNPIAFLVFAGHGDVGVQRVGPSSVNDELNALDGFTAATFFQNINFVNKPKIELQGCGSGASVSRKDSSLALGISIIIRGEVIAPISNSKVSSNLSIVGKRYSYDPRESVKYVNGVKE